MGLALQITVQVAFLCSACHDHRWCVLCVVRLEYTAQFAVYSVLASPIVVSADLRAGSVLYTEQRGQDCLEKLLKNKEILQVQ